MHRRLTLKVACVQLEDEAGIFFKCDFVLQFFHVFCEIRCEGLEFGLLGAN